MANQDAVSTAPGHAVTFDVLANDTDPQGLPLTLTTESQPFSGVVLCSPSGDCTYTPAVGFRGKDAFGYAISDGAGGTAAGTVVITVGLPPTASFGISSTCGRAPLDVHFDASASSDPAGSIESYAWSFGDGSTGTGITTDHVFGSAGTYQATLTVTNDLGLTGSTSVAVPVGPSAPVQPTRIVGNADVTGGGRLAVDLTRVAMPFGLKPIWFGSVGYLDQHAKVAALAWVLTNHTVVRPLAGSCDGVTIVVTADDMFRMISKPLSVEIDDTGHGPGDTVSLVFGQASAQGVTDWGDLTVR